MQLAFRSPFYGEPSNGPTVLPVSGCEGVEYGARRRGHLVSGRELPARPLVAWLRDLARGGAARVSAGAVAGNPAGVGRGLVPVHGHRALRGHHAPQQARPEGARRDGPPRPLGRRGRAARRRCGLRDRRAVPGLPVRGEPGQRSGQSRPARDLPGHLAGQRGDDHVRGNLAAAGCAAGTGHQHRHVRLLSRRPRCGDLRRQPPEPWPGVRADQLAAV